jgi:hypothetical protein
MDHRTRRRSTSLVWLDSREAFIVHPEGAQIVVAHLASEVPPRHRATRHIRRDPGVRHGGGVDQEGAERRRLERLDRFVDAVRERLDERDDIIVVGPGSARERLARRLAEVDAARHARRLVSTARAARTTVPRLVARLRQATEQQLPRRQPNRHGWPDRLASREPARAEA